MVGGASMQQPSARTNLSGYPPQMPHGMMQQPPPGTMLSAKAESIGMVHQAPFGGGGLTRKSFSVPSSLNELDGSERMTSHGGGKSADGSLAPPAPLSRDDRWKRIMRFKNEKKPRLNFEASKKVAYQSRKKHADGQPRVGGRFVSKKMLAEMVAASSSPLESPQAASPCAELATPQAGSPNTSDEAMAASTMPPKMDATETVASTLPTKVEATEAAPAPMTTSSA